MGRSATQIGGVTMKWLKKLNNPFVLGLNGFVAGALLFFATHPDAAGSIAGDSARQDSAQQRQQVRQGA
jgi:hypothetical protein